MTAAPGKKSKFERFHGAFTGGFSAGYFNTVGSENNAGFQPSTFVSSRSSRFAKTKFGCTYRDHTHPYSIELLLISLRHGRNITWMMKMDYSAGTYPLNR